MLHIETFTEGNANFVKLPQVEFDNLLQELEDLRDIQTIRMAKEQEAFPAELVYKLASVKTSGRRIAIWREYRGLKRDELAGKASVTGSYISMIENGKRKGDIEIFKKIADALGCDIDDLV